MLFVQLQGWMKHKFNVHDYESTPPFNICSISWCSSYGKSWDFIFACVNLPFEYHTDKCNLWWCSSLSKDKQHVERIARPNSQGRFYKPCLVLIFVENYEDHWQEEQPLMFEISGEKTVMVLKGFPVKGLNTSWQGKQYHSWINTLLCWECSDDEKNDISFPAGVVVQVMFAGKLLVCPIIVNHTSSCASILVTAC